MLIMEDDPMVAELNRRYLEQLSGFTRVATARSVEDALGLLEKYQIDLILLDIFMPDRNGLDLLAQIRGMGKEIDIIVVSAACDQASITRALRHGAVDYLIKPFEFERFHEALSNYRERVMVMQSRAAVSQDELDRRVLGKVQRSENAEFVKGLDANTLKKVWERIQASHGEPFTTEEIANRVGISRVSMRKYLKFLNQIKAVSVEIIYGSVGRPVYTYRCIHPQSHIIKRYC